MASITKRYGYSVDFRKKGRLSVPDTIAALKRAQDENRVLAERMVKQIASRRIKGDYRYPPRRRRASMVSEYRATVSDRGRTLTLTNPTQRALWFEFGTRPHDITAKPGAPTGSRGTAIRGKSKLSWKYSPGGRWYTADKVKHPGTKGQFPIAYTMETLDGAFARNIARELDAAFEGRR